MKTVKYLFSLILLFSMVLTAGCTAQETPAPTGGYITGATLTKTEAGEQEYFQIKMDQAGTIGLDFWAQFSQGQAAVRIRDTASGELVSEIPLDGTTTKINTKIELPAGNYSLLMGWDAPVNATFSLEWQPGAVELPEITPMVLVSGIGMLLFGLLFLITGARSGGWKFAWLGGGFWAGTVAVKFGLAAVINSPLYQLITNSLPGLPGTILFSLYVGLLTGVTENLITWLVLRGTKLGQAPRGKAFSFSMGFGAIEAILLALLNLVSMISVLSTQSQLPAYSLRTVAASNNLLYDLAPIMERIFTIGVHLGCNVLLFYAVYKKQARWFWASFALKSGIDAVAGFAQISGDLTSITYIWMIEAIVILFGLVGFWLSRKYLPRLPEKTVETVAIPAE